MRSARRRDGEKTRGMIEQKSSEIKHRRGGIRPGAGRPLGSPNKLTRPVKELAADQGPASIAKLIQLRDHAESEQVQYAACRELLDRGLGKARQELDVTQHAGVTVHVHRELLSEKTVPAVVPPSELEDHSVNGTGGE